MMQSATVNQRLYYCRLHLVWFSEQLKTEQIPKHILEQSLGESLIFHLIMAYRAYLSEVAESCSVSENIFHTASDIMSKLQQMNNHCAVVNELVILETSDSWLFELLHRSARLGQSEIRSPAISKNSDIQIKHIEEDTVLLTIERGEYIFNALKELIDQQRLQFEEW